MQRKDHQFPAIPAGGITRNPQARNPGGCSRKISRAGARWDSGQQPANGASRFAHQGGDDHRRSWWSGDSAKLAAQGIRWKRLDEDGCAELLAFLCARTNAVPYEELKGAGWEEWFEQLRCIEAVHFLQKGLVLSDELRDELNGINTN